jgi:hypothetical protein
MLEFGTAVLSSGTVILASRSFFFLILPVNPIAAGQSHLYTVASLAAEISACSTGLRDGAYPWDEPALALLWRCVAAAVAEPAAGETDGVHVGTATQRLETLRPVVVCMLEVS